MRGEWKDLNVNIRGIERKGGRRTISIGKLKRMSSLEGERGEIAEKRRF